MEICKMIGEKQTGQVRLVNLLKRYLSWFFVPICLIFTDAVGQNSNYELFINEFMASNAATIDDPDFRDDSDWLEIYNAGDSVIQLQGFFLSDDLDEPFKWQIPIKFTLRPKKCTIFWADGKNTGRHTNFKLSKDGEQISLFAPNGSLLDTLSFGFQQTDISSGRYPDGSKNWYYFKEPTPGLPNDSKGFQGFVLLPQFSLQAGFYNDSQTVEIISDDPTATIRFTRDGSLPDENSETYSSPILIDTTTVLRAHGFKDGYIPSTTITNSYFIDESISLPVVSIATAPANLWDDELGIYVAGTNGITGYCSRTAKNWNRDWERLVSLELFEENGTRGFHINAGMKIGGGCTRKYPQKTLAIYVRTKYGTGQINYKFFDDKSITSFNNIILRNFGQDFYRTLFRDLMMQSLIKDRMDVDWQAGQPAVVFLNGVYWGIHNIREKHNEHYFESNYDLNPKKIDILFGNASVKQGSPDHYKNMINFIKSNDIAINENYQYIATQMDINNYIDYQIAEIYFANFDWPANNQKYWRSQTSDGKWRWIIFDLDLGFGAHSNGQYDTNTLENASTENGQYYSNPPWSTFLFRSLLKNQSFRNEFIQRFVIHLSTTFKLQRVLPFIDRFKNKIAQEVPRHNTKWQDSMSFGNSWEELIDVLRQFARKRPDFVRIHLENKFDLNTPVKLSITKNDSLAGKILANGVEIQNNTYEIIVFKNIPIKFTAVPAKGYHFVQWQGLSDGISDSIYVFLTDNDSLTAVFEQDVSQTPNDDANQINTRYHLGQNYPNPFNPVTRIHFRIPREQWVFLLVYDLLGNEVAKLVDNRLMAGNHKIIFNGSKLPSGIYIYKMQAGVYSAQKKFIMLK